MIKLVPGGKVPVYDCCGLCNTTRAMRFTRMKRSSKCMQILHEIITHSDTQREIKKRVYGHEMGESCNGFFASLHHFGLATFIRDNNKYIWIPTPEGILFYVNLPE